MVYENSRQQSGRAQQETTVVTTTTEAPLQQNQDQLMEAKVMNRDAIISEVQEQAVLENVIERKNVEVHHRPVVQEIHEQKIIEIQKQPMIQQVQGETQFMQSTAETQFEELGSRELGEEERLRLQSLQVSGAPKISQTGSVQEAFAGEVVAEVINQEVIERHVQPVITEVRDQKVVQEVLHPVVRTIYEQPIVREVPFEGSSALLNEQRFDQQYQDQQFQQQQFQQGGNVTATTTTESSALGATTTTTSGSSVTGTQQQNLAKHEQKLENTGAMGSVEQSNLQQHEAAVNQVTGSNSNYSGNSYAEEGENKPGLMTRIKDKLHFGSHKNQ